MFVVEGDGAYDHAHERGRILLAMRRDLNYRDYKAEDPCIGNVLGEAYSYTRVYRYIYIHKRK